jgi:hypothetical protein
MVSGITYLQNNKDIDTCNRNIMISIIYFVVGIALLAMMFDLIQDQILGKVKRISELLGIHSEEESAEKNEEDFDEMPPDEENGNEEEEAGEEENSNEERIASRTSRASRASRASALSESGPNDQEQDVSVDNVEDYERENTRTSASARSDNFRDLTNAIQPMTFKDKYGRARTRDYFKSAESKA